MGSISSSAKMANNKPIFCITHPRACSTAFERVFMTRTDDMVCLHEPFGDAFYYGPERMSTRFEDDEETRVKSGFDKSTYQSIFDRIERDGSEGKRVFIKDMIYYLFPPNGKPPQIAPSLMKRKRGIGTESNGIANGATNGATDSAPNSQPKTPFPYGTHPEPGNPTVVPVELLKQFHFTFLIRDPHYSIPSFYRCCIPPLSDMTGYGEFMVSEAGYEEVRRTFDYLISSGRVGPDFAGKEGTTNGSISQSPTSNGTEDHNEVCVIDADDLLDDPEGIISSYCNSIGLRYDPSMLKWEGKEHLNRAETAFEKWKGWHDDALESKDLKPRTHKKARKTEDEFDHEWTQKYGLKGANIIRQAVNENMDTYLYLKQFALRV